MANAFKGEKVKEWKNGCAI